MCGIVGIIAKDERGFFGDKADIFEELLYADALRGMDSTGCFMVNRKNQVNGVKQAVEAGLFIRTRSFQQFKKEISKARFVIGHNRKATSGETVSKNAHPFVKDHIVLVHNGFVGNYKELDEKVDVDSQAIVSVLLKEDDAIKALQQIRGAYALAWYNHKTKKLFIGTNGDRPLSYAVAGDDIFLASEKNMLGWILDRNRYNIPLQEFKPNILAELSFDPFKMVLKDIPGKNYVTLPTSNDYSPDWKKRMNHDDTFGYPPDLTGIGSSCMNDDAEAEEGGAELAEVRRHQTINNDELHNTAKDMMRYYVQGTLVQFRATGMQKLGDHTRVDGFVWVPGKAIKPARFFIEDINDREEYIGSKVPLVARILNVTRQNKDVYYSLDPKSVQLPGNILKDIVGRQFGTEEWHAICDNVKCKKCSNSINKVRIDLTEIIRKGDGSYDVMCDRCINQQTDKESNETFAG